MSQLDVARPPGPDDSGTAGGTRSDLDRASNRRWLWTWITIAILVLIVVIGFLLGIVSSLRSIDGALAEADRAVSGAGEDVDPLPAQVAAVNDTLGRVDTELEPISDRADEIITGLTAIRDNLELIDRSLVATSGSLADTSSSLQGTSGSLVDTSAVLEEVLGLAGEVEITLEEAESPPDDLGAEDIYERVAVVNGVLSDAERDTGNILAGLQEVNEHLESICRSPVVEASGRTRGAGATC